jgi:hypothetical protein
MNPARDREEFSGAEDLEGVAKELSRSSRATDRTPRHSIHAVAKGRMR